MGMFNASGRDGMAEWPPRASANAHALVRQGAAGVRPRGTASPMTSQARGAPRGGLTHDTKIYFLNLNKNNFLDLTLTHVNLAKKKKSIQKKSSLRTSPKP
jgi:hypothetical protein